MNEQQILEYIKYGVWILFGSGILFEISPIKFNPISTVLGWLGNKLNKDVKEDIKQLKSDITEVKNDLQEHTVESIRKEILNFANDLKRDERKSEEHFNYILALHDRYERYTEINKIKNSQIDIAFKLIKQRYKDCWEHNSFL